MNKKFLLAPLAAVAALGGALAMGGTAHAATGYTDTSVQGSNFVFQHYVTGPANVSNHTVQGDGVVDIDGIAAFPAPISGHGVTYAIASSTDVDGQTLAVTNGGGIITTGILSVSGVFNHDAGASVQTTVKLTATDKYGDVAVVMLPVTVDNHNNVTIDRHQSVTTDDVYDLGIGDNNPDGSVSFTAKSTQDSALTFAETNLPTGLASGSPELKPGTAVPGSYKDMNVTATDAEGAVAAGTFTLTVNGGATATAPVPVLSHGSAVSVSNNRENVYFDTTITTWVHFQIVGPGAINGHEGWVLATAGSLNKAVYSGLEAGHTYAVFYTPVTGQNSTTQIVGTSTGHVTFITTRNK